MRGGSKEVEEALKGKGRNMWVEEGKVKGEICPL